MTGLDQIRAGLTAELARLDSERARVQSALAALGGTTSNGGGRARQKRAPRGSVTARILEALPADGATIHQADLGRAAGIRAQHAAACIARLLKAGRIERVDRGLYRWPAPAAAINHAPGEWVSQVS